MNSHHVAIMQPYLFPYIGYFHLIDASDTFVFYDDVHYIKRGWINRNRMLNSGKPLLFTVPVSKASQNNLINEQRLVLDENWKHKFLNQLTHSYRKATFFPEVSELVRKVFDQDHGSIANLTIESIKSVFRYLGKQTSFVKSSDCSPSTKGIEKADRLIQITKDLGYDAYVNAIGGKELYSKDYFAAKGVELSFVKSNNINYRQFSGEFVPWLSIIDVLMFNEKELVVEFFSEYSLE